MTRINKTIEINGGPTYIALGALRYLVEQTKAQPDDKMVMVKVDGPYNHPTDPGSSSLSVTVEEEV